MPFCLEVFETIQTNDADSERTIRELFASGEDISEQDTGAGSPLIWASVLGHARLVVLLIELGVDLDEPHNSNLMTALHVAAASGKTDCVQTLTAAGARLESRDNQGWTPLMFAAQEGCPEVVDVLISAGADVSAKDSMNRPALAVVDAALHPWRRREDSFVTLLCRRSSNGICGQADQVF